MKLEYHKFGDILTATRHDESFRFGCDDQLQLLAWFAREKPQMVREAMLPDCPHHTCVVHTGDKEEAPKHYCKVVEILEKEVADQDAIAAHYKGHHKEIHESISKALGYAIALLNGEGECK
jgi:hypothetical protein